MASIVVWLVGLLFIGVGVWILLLRFEGLVDIFSPHSMSIGRMTVDGADSKGYAELLRARFDHHFRRPTTLSNETGFLEAAALDTPELFQQKPLESALENVTVEVSGLDVAKFLQFLDQAVRPGQWVIEGDFQTRPDRALLALRLSRGPRLIRTWYLERPGNASDKSDSLEQLVDDAIFQLVYDFGNNADQNKDLRKWRGVVPVPDGFPSPSAVGAYYEARGALDRYYAHRNWKDLDLALDRLRTLRGEMPKYVNGLLLLGMTLAEKRNETEAIHVYEQLRLLLLAGVDDWTQLPPDAKRRLLSVELLKATATVRLDTWQSTHDAIADLLQLDRSLGAVSVDHLSKLEQASYGELRAQTAVQLAYAYALYLSYIRDYQVAEIFGSQSAPAELRVSDPAQLQVLNEGPVRDAKAIVRQTMRTVVDHYARWLAKATQAQSDLRTAWSAFPDASRRRAELVSRLSLTAGYAEYRMAEWESADNTQSERVFGEPFKVRLDRAASKLADADAAHPSHYLVLQLLGLVYSEPRREDASLSVAEQYFERAIQAKPTDYYGHQLLAGLLLRRVAHAGVDVTARPLMERGLGEAQAAAAQRDVSGAAHLLKAEFLTRLLDIERDEARRRELREGLVHAIDQAARFLPLVFKQEDVDLTWVRVMSSARRLGEEAEGLGPTPGRSLNNSDALKRQRFTESQTKLLSMVAALITACENLEARWVNSQRVFHVSGLKANAARLKAEIERSTLENWREIAVPLW